MILALILGFVLGAGALLFILQNTSTVSLVFMQFQFETSVALVVILSLLVGFVLALLITLPGAIGGAFRERRLRKHNEMLTREANIQKQIADQNAARLEATRVIHPTPTI